MANLSGKSLGGKNRAKALCSEERKNIASNAAKTRWESEKKLPKATHRGEIVIGDIKIRCAVLDDGRRVLSENGINNILGTSGGKSYKLRDNNMIFDKPLPLFVASKSLIPFLDETFENQDFQSLEYKDGRKKVVGFSATILPKVCDVWLKAREANTLQPSQQQKALNAEILMRGLAHLGIVALVDEATGYQEERDRDELHKLLAVYLSEERLKWAKRFPDEFYKQIYRLKGWKYPSKSGHRPGIVGKLTNQLVYEKLPRGVLEELRKRNPTRIGTSQRKWKHHQFLSEDIGQEDLRDHLLQLIAILRISKIGNILSNFKMAFPQSGEQLDLDFGEIKLK